MDRRILKKLETIKEQISLTYTNGETIKSLAKFYNCSTSTIWSILKLNNTPRRKRGPKSKEK
jgi:Mor family transcriptional regulator